MDYAWGRPSINAMRLNGISYACRYLSWLPNGKCLSRAEADGLRANGIDVVSNWEFFGDWEHDYSGGYARGRQHAAEAAMQHATCGGPSGRPIYFSTDFNPADGQFALIAEYYRGVASVIGLPRTGAYGGYRTIKFLFDLGLITYGWQTYAWSGIPTTWDSRAQLRQIKNGVLVGGIDCDLNDAMTADWGQWGYEGELMATASEIIVAWSQGMTKTPDGTQVAPVIWRIRDEAWMSGVEGTVARVTAAAEARDTATVAALTALATTIQTGGGDVDVAAILAAIAEATEAATEVADKQAATIAELRNELSQLRHAVAAGGAATAAGLEESA
jgi:hypothetical protein